MAIHELEPVTANLHGPFSCERLPILRVASGDTVRFRSLEAGWSEFHQAEEFAKPGKVEAPTKGDYEGHCLVGPVYVEGAVAGGCLEVRITRIRTGKWGFSAAAGFPGFVNDQLGFTDLEGFFWHWKLDPDSGWAMNQHGREVKMRPFCGVMGTPPSEPGMHSTVPPRSFGGNMDCKELIEGTVLYLPLAVDGALFSVGDGHALQGDGEVATLAIECPMELVEVELHARPDLSLKNPRALTPSGWVTLGFHEDLNQAMLQALDGMLDLLVELNGISRTEALAIASLQVDLRITQVVNGVKGVHAVWVPK